MILDQNIAKLIFKRKEKEKQKKYTIYFTEMQKNTKYYLNGDGFNKKTMLEKNIHIVAWRFFSSKDKRKASLEIDRVWRI